MIAIISYAKKKQINVDGDYHNLTIRAILPVIPMVSQHLRALQAITPYTILLTQIVRVWMVT